MAGTDARPGAPIVDVLRESIRQRMLPPGMPLVQQTIADALGVSRIPVRDALQRLASEGLVTLTDDGAHVTSLSREEMEELWSLRAVIEPAMADAIVRNVTPRDLEELGALVTSMDAAGEVDEWSNQNYAFHEALYRISGLAHYRAVALRVLNLIEPYSRVVAELLRQRDMAQAEHHQMLDALAAGDAERLRSLLTVHSTRACSALVDYAAETPPQMRADPAAEAARELADRLLGEAASA